jgi:hypothetical protein
MADKPPAFTVTDRRKFTVDGDLRDATTEESITPQPPAPVAGQLSPNMAEAVHPAPGVAAASPDIAEAVHPAPGRFTANMAEAVHPAPGVAAASPNIAEAVHPAPGSFAATSGVAQPTLPSAQAARPNMAEAVHPAPGVAVASARVVTMPAPAAAQPATVSNIAASAPTQEAPPEDLQETMEDAAEEGDLLAEPTDAESAEQHAAYRASSQQLDNLIRQQNPGAKPSAEVTMDHVLQSIYLSAVVAMGAATEPGQKPRIDIIGARQSIEMLIVLQEKTKGNLNENEQRLLQNMLFELRMMFLEITNAIAQQAQNPPSGIIR